MWIIDRCLFEFLGTCVSVDDHESVESEELDVADKVASDSWSMVGL